MNKSADELGIILNKMYHKAPRKETVTMVHLFGIRYPEDIRRAGVKEVTKAAGIGDEYKAEVNKGIKLAPYATLSPEVLAQLDLLIA